MRFQQPAELSPLIVDTPDAMTQCRVALEKVWLREWFFPMA